MTCIAVQCLHCHSEQVVTRGKTDSGTQRYLCQNTACVQGSFLLDYRNRGGVPEVKQHIIDMSLNASGIRNTARVLHISPNTVLHELKKKAVVHIECAGEAEMDEMWSFVSKKGNERWLWHAIDHHTGTVLAYVFGRRKDEVFLQRKTMLEPFGLTRFSTDFWGAYTRYLDPDVHSPGK